MEVQSDFRDLLELFNKHHVEFLLVGGYALAFHGGGRPCELGLPVNAGEVCCRSQMVSTASS